jgi:hypothetical protein
MACGALRRKRGAVVGVQQCGTSVHPGLHLPVAVLGGGAGVGHQLHLRSSCTGWWPFHVQLAAVVPCPEEATRVKD